jgi:spore maturation protein B
VLIVPALMLFTLILGIINRISVFESFAQGAREAFKLIYNTLPYLIAIFMAIELLRASGLAALLSDILAPFFKLVGIPKELAELIVLRPLSGSGSLIVLENIYAQYGVDSYISNTASVIMASSDTVLYICAVYFSTSKNKKTGLAIPIALFVSFASAVFACLLMKLF